MSREIKFRAWDKEEKKMVQNSAYSITLTGGILAHGEHDVAPDRLIIMQYTGLKDKNGKEIYIGDFLKLNNENYDPEYDLFYEGIVLVEAREDLGYSFKMINPTSKEIGEWWDSTSFWHVGEEDTTEVIGNIYENPELLNEKESTRRHIKRSERAVANI